MFKNRFKYTFSIVILLFVVKVNANEPEFSQFYANKLYLNPAFAGATEDAGLFLSYRDQRFYSQFISNAIHVSFDQYLYSLKGGGGVQFLNYKEGVLDYFQLGAMYSYGVKIANEFNIRVGIQATVFQKQISTGEFIFPSQIDVFGDNLSTSSVVENAKSGLIYDFSTGMVGTRRNSYFGIAIHHLTEPNENKNLSSSSSLIKRKYTIHYGTQIKIFKDGLIKERYTLSPNILYQYQYTHRVHYGLYATVQNVWFGAWLRQDFKFVYDAAIFLAGVSFQDMDVSYSFDLGLPKSKVFIKMATHEVTFRFKFQYKQAVKIEAIKCPKF